HSLVAREGSADWHEAWQEPEFADLFADPLPLEPISGVGQKAEGTRSHFAVVIDHKSRAPGNLEGAIASLGPAYRLLHNVWIISPDQTVNAVRNRLVQELGKADSLFVIDASRGKAAWFNFGPEADVRIRRVWQKAS